MISWPGDLTNGHERLLEFERLMRIWGPFSPDDFEDVLLNRGMILLAGKILDVFRPVRGRVGRRLGCGRAWHCRSGDYR